MIDIWENEEGDNEAKEITNFNYYLLIHSLPLSFIGDMIQKKM